MKRNHSSIAFMSGGAGAVFAAAGGRLASCGLTGTTGMRLFGIGVDQVFFEEMVMPNGLHVRVC